MEPSLSCDYCDSCFCETSVPFILGKQASTETTPAAASVTGKKKKKHPAYPQILQTDRTVLQRSDTRSAQGRSFRATHAAPANTEKFFSTVTDWFVLWLVPPSLTPLSRCERNDGADRLDGARRRIRAFGHGLLGFFQVRQSHALPAQRERLSPAQKHTAAAFQRAHSWEPASPPFQEFWF